MLSRSIWLCLRLGMYLSFALLAIGIMLYLWQDGEAGSVLGPLEALEAMLRGEAMGFISAGILVLIATPLAGVLAALAVFAYAREWNFVGVSLAVLAVVALAILMKVFA